jgi:polyisoprenoid-binding protein YceI
MNSKNLVIVIVVVALLGALGWYFKSKNEVAVVDTNTEVENTLKVAETQKALSVSNTESEATYEIDEKLQGKPVRVVGKNKGVEGSVVIDSNTKNIIKATVLLDANGFVTDIAKRDENVKSLVLKSNQELNKYITFTTTKIEGLPEKLENNTEYTAKVTGDLTIGGVTKEIPFDATVKYVDNGSLTVNAKTQLAYEEFGITIPNLPFLSDVSKVVDLHIVLVAR